ncbi:hypothetical protein GIB67_009536 [Kingdonia uniflora]|uniref:Uncharacterized protein n=1 Tax=Kingdonia uniflora TaxID=39325 RepID=A0A7J7NW13_9MAGN|nr:hypothetical protein GIB67_009536 [Kingdonia uniflora]
MDLWVVAAATGAAYIAKYRQKFSREKEGLGETFIGDSSSVMSDNRSLPTCSLVRLAPRESGEEASSSRVATEMVSTSGFNGETPGFEAGFDDYNVLSLASLPLGFSNGFKMNGNNEVDGKCSGDLRDVSRTEMGVRYGSGRRVSSLRSKRSAHYNVKPRSSLESCLIAQLYKQHDEMEEYMLSSLSSPRQQSVRPLLVTNGSRIISRANGDSCGVQFENGGNKWHRENGFYSEENGAVLGIPPLQLPEIDPMKHRKKPKEKKRKREHGRSTRSRTRIPDNHCQPQGSPGGMFLFCLGITFGVISTVMANKREVEKVSELLKQTENLVQDLQEELEMKDSLTVKELANEDCEISSKYDKVQNDQKCEEKLVSMSEIEAELEAELERLELNMNSSCLQRRFSGIDEIDPDFVAEVVQGEFKADMMNGQADSDKDASGTSTTETQNANYAVSPRELSMRLHEVIQSRLEERIMELESALQNTVKKVHLIGSNQMSSPRDFLNSEIGSSSQGSSTMIEVEGNTIAQQPLFLNLSGDALNAYDEAYEEFIKITGDDETQSNGSLHHLNSRSLIHDKIRTWDESILRSRRSEEVCESEDGDEEHDDDGDLIGKLLIKQIVEKARQGSPVVLNAQRQLFLLKEEL